MDNKLLFNARDWKLNPECTTNKGERSFITGLNDDLAEAFTIGSWGSNRDWTEIISPTLILEKNKEYTFTFWLNGGENDRNGDEVCQLHIIFNNDKENALVYKLNRNFIKPYKRYHGWNLYEIPFKTRENEYTQLKFIAYNAYTTIMGSKEKEAYTDLEEVLDEFEGLRPQRHNIVWADGWPTNTWYSTKTLKEKQKNGTPQSLGNMNREGFMSPPFGRGNKGGYMSPPFGNGNKDGFIVPPFGNMNKDFKKEIQDEIRNKLEEEGFEDILEDIREDVRDEILEKFNVDEFTKSLKESFMK